ncbi:nickel-binding protein [Salsipaludibacter albus]|uniref:nickel-binding protein n=1 Tax=Salsipaludibacter albus TaxID=2849650 RepID=UPI001EE3F31A|nr:nickel-binding protein [Salsipaludibacter albus]MBY5161308.1 DUF4242 domain-containing protein [Salsipaludibacter albus]
MMDLFAIHRRRLCDPTELAEVDRRSQAELDRRSDEVRKIRSYVLDDEDGTVGTICLYEATGTDAIHAHARAADLPVTTIDRISTIDVHRPDPATLTS